MGRVHNERARLPLRTMPSKSVAINAPRRRDEVFNKMMRAQIRAHHKQLYADVGAQLGLSKDEASKLIDLLTDQQLAGS